MTPLGPLTPQKGGSPEKKTAFLVVFLYFFILKCIIFGYFYGFSLFLVVGTQENQNKQFLTKKIFGAQPQFFKILLFLIKKQVSCYRYSCTTGVKFLN